MKIFAFSHRYVYRHTWVCNLSHKHKSENSKRDQKCKAKLDIKIKKITKDTRKKDPYIGENDPPLPAIVKITGSHSHHTNTFDSMRFLRPDEKLRKIFEDYFSDGLSPSAAIKIQWDKIRQTEAGTEDVADRHKVPSKKTVYWWYKVWTENNFGTATEPLEKLQEKVESYEKGSLLTYTKIITCWKNVKRS